jgi:hypothetical protein
MACFGPTRCNITGSNSNITNINDMVGWLRRSGSEILDRMSHLAIGDSGGACAAVLPGPAVSFGDVAHENCQWQVCGQSLSSEGPAQLSKYQQVCGVWIVRQCDNMEFCSALGHDVDTKSRFRATVKDVTGAGIHTGFTGGDPPKKKTKFTNRCLSEVEPEYLCLSDAPLDQCIT